MANMIVTLPNGLVIKTKISKVKTESEDRSAIIRRTEEGLLVSKLRQTDTGQVFDKFSYIDVDSHGKKLTKKDKILDYILNEKGEEVRVKPFESTGHVTLSWDYSIPANYVSQLLQESVYEVYAEGTEMRQLCEVIDEAIEKDVAFIHENFIWRKGYTSHHAVFIPFRSVEGKYGLVMVTTQGKSLYEHRMFLEAEDEAKEVKVLPSLLNAFIG